MVFLLDFLQYCFYLMFNVMLSKEKLNFKLLQWISPLILCNASFKCTYKTFTWYVESPESHNVCFITGTCVMYFIPTRTVKTLHKTKSTVFTSLFDMHVFYYAANLWPADECGERLRGRRATDCLIFPFLSVSSISAWVVDEYRQVTGK